GGWLLAQPLARLNTGLRPDQITLVGAVLSLALLVATRRWRLRTAWGTGQPWQALGVAAPPALALRSLVRGLLKALLLLGLVVVGLLACGQASWSGRIDAAEVLNAIALVLGVGFAEEL
ncbi:MAG: CPBP family intramembrane glutamate endopeptidase, partial [Cyanobacteriota bacterium]